MRNGIGRWREDAAEAVADDAFHRSETVDHRAAVTREHALSREEHRPDQRVVECTPMRVTVAALSRVIGVEGDQPVEAPGAQLAFEDLHFGLE